MPVVLGGAGRERFREGNSTTRSPPMDPMALSVGPDVVERGGRGGDEGLRERAGDMSQTRGGNAAKMKFASGLTTQIFVPWLI